MAQFLQAEGIVIGDGQGGNIALDIKTAVLRNLHQSLATFLQARAPQSMSVIGGGSINYRVPLYGSTKAYQVGQTVDVVPNVANIGVKVSDYRTAFYEIESFDVSMLNGDGQAAIAEIAANLTQQIRADQNAHFFMALDDYFEDHPEQSLYLPELVSEQVLTVDQGRMLQKAVANAVNRMTKIINNKYIGVKGSEFFGLIDRFAATNLSLVLTALNASNSAYDLMVQGIDGDTLETFRFGGVTFLIDNFLNNSVAQGASFNGDYDLDLMERFGFVIHREFLAFPMGIENITSVVNPNNANLRYIAKYCFGSGVLRPELGLAFTNSAYAADAEVVVGSDVELVHNLSTAANITAAAAGNYATVVVENGKVIVTGVSAGNETITLSIGGVAVATATVTVKAA